MLLLEKTETKDNFQNGVKILYIFLEMSELRNIFFREDGDKGQLS